MDKNSKVRNFLKKEGFYVILFVCLCVVATVATVTARKDAKSTAEVTNTQEGNELAEKDDSVIKFDDAELVKEMNGAKDKLEAKNEEPTVVKKEEPTVATSAEVKVSFVNPVNNGTITRKYNINPRLNEEKTGATVFKGVDIEAPVGTEVKAISSGNVLQAEQGDSKLGYFVTVEHADGVIATYANLAEDLKVKAGDKVSQGTVLGTIGDTIATNPEDRVSENYVLLHMEKSGEPVDPQKYLTQVPVK